MLFNSVAFLFIFLPAVLLGFQLLVRWTSPGAALAWMAFASLVFYGFWSLAFLALLLGSIGFNHLMAGVILKSAGLARSKACLALAIAVNLAVLIWFKYANFFLDTAGLVLGRPTPVLDIVLPVGISFFTFTQIAYLVDLYRDPRHTSALLPYVLFVTWFPHAVAGPIIHHARVMPQFGHAFTRGLTLHNLALGGTLFVLGLSKKLLLADPLADHVQPVFAAAQQGIAVSPMAAWSGTLAYSLQLYFDFSGYSDMACGLSCLFGVRLPMNFLSPYKATSLIDFWRRWHISLSSFLRRYLYIPLGGNRQGQVRRWLNLFITMLLGGLWHGASLTFALWGALHGLGLMVNHGWRALRQRTGFAWGGKTHRAASRGLGLMLTFLFVSVAWIPFRAHDLTSALQLSRSLFGAASGPLSVESPSVFGWLQGGLGPVLDRWVQGAMPQLVHIENGATLPWIVLGLAFVWLAPNTHELMGPRVSDTAPLGDPARKRGRLRWRPSFAWALVTAALLALCLLNLHRESPFLYFQF